MQTVEPISRQISCQSSSLFFPSISTALSLTSPEDDHPLPPSSKCLQAESQHKIWLPLCAALFQGTRNLSCLLLFSEKNYSVCVREIFSSYWWLEVQSRMLKVYGSWRPITTAWNWSRYIHFCILPVHSYYCSHHDKNTQTFINILLRKISIFYKTNVYV